MLLNTEMYQASLAYDPYFFKRNYKLGPEIGRGGFGVVYSGFRLLDRYSVAIKYVARRNVTEWAPVSTVTLNVFLIYAVISCLDGCSKSPTDLLLR